MVRVWHSGAIFWAARLYFWTWRARHSPVYLDHSYTGASVEVSSGQSAATFMPCSGR